MSKKYNFSATVVNETIGIGSGQTNSTLFDCGGMQSRALQFPANWTDCNVSFKAANVDDVNQTYDITNVDGTPLSIPTTAQQWLPLIPYLFDSAKYIQIICDTTQSEAVVLGINLEPIYQGIHG